MSRADNDATLPGQASTQPNDLSRAGQLLFRSLEQRMFGQAEPQQLGRYHLIDTLGRGAMGIVYRAYDPDLDRRVAIKVVTLDGAEARARMVREAKALAKLNHPNVVTVHEVGEDGDDLFVVMEYVDGGTLVDWIREHPMSEEGRTHALVELLLQALEGLAAAHELDLVHRDIKPANMLVGADGRLRVADFGLARGAQQDHETTVDDGPGESLAITRVGQLVGTPAFMAPEQFRGIADARSDQFSLAVSFYLAFYGRRPYAADSLIDLIELLEAERFEAPSSGNVPDFVRQVLLRAMRAKPEDRFLNVREMALALRSGARRRRRLIGGVALCSVAAAIAGVGWATTPASCSEERERAEAAVSSHVDRINRLVTESGRSHPEEVSGRFESSIDGLVERWSTQHLQACRDARAREPETAALAQRRMECLDDGLAAVEHALTEIDDLTMAQADSLSGTAEFLVGLVECRNPEDQPSGDRGRELLAAFRGGKLAESRLEFDEARERFTSVLDATQPGEFPDLRAAVHIRLSAIAVGLGDRETMERHTLASLEEAERAGDPELLALDWLYLADMLPMDGPERTFELFVTLSHAARERGPVPDSVLADLGMREATLRLHRGQIEQARGLSRDAVELARRSNRHVLPYALLTESMVIHRGGDLAIAEQKAEEAVAALAELVGEHHPDVAGLRMHLADLQSWRGEDEQAIATLDRAVEVLQERPDYQTSNLYHALIGRGDSKRNMRRAEEAVLDYDRALALAEASPRSDISVRSAQLSKARAFWTLERDEEALALLDVVLANIQPHEVHEFDTRADAALLRASILAFGNEPDQARRRVEEALPWIDEAFGTEGAPRLQAAVELADLWTQIGDYDRALAEVERFLPLAEEELMFKAMLERAKAECLLAQGKRDDARVWAEKAFETMRASGAGEHEFIDIRMVLDSLNEPDPRVEAPAVAAPSP